MDDEHQRPFVRQAVHPICLHSCVRASPSAPHQRIRQVPLHRLLQGEQPRPPTEDPAVRKRQQHQRDVHRRMRRGQLDLLRHPVQPRVLGRADHPHPRGRRGQLQLPLLRRHQRDLRRQRRRRRRRRGLHLPVRRQHAVQRQHDQPLQPVVAHLRPLHQPRRPGVHEHRLLHGGHEFARAAERQDGRQRQRHDGRGVRRCVRRVGVCLRGARVWAGVLVRERVRGGRGAGWERGL